METLSWKQSRIMIPHFNQGLLNSSDINPLCRSLGAVSLPIHFLQVATMTAMPACPSLTDSLPASCH